MRHPPPLLRGALVLAALAGVPNQLPAQSVTFLYQESPPHSIGYGGAAAAGSDGIYVTSGAVGLSGSAPDGFVRKFDNSGVGLWSRNLGGASLVTAVAASDSGVYAAGNTEWDLKQQTYYVLPGQTPAGLRDAFIRRYDPLGNELWTRQFGDTNNDYADSLAADTSGVYVAGRSGVNPGEGGWGIVFLRKFDSNGNLLWKWNFDGASAPVHVAADATGAYTVGSYNGSAQPYFRKFNASGDFLWTRFVEFDALAYVTGIATNSHAVFIAGWFENGNGRQRFLRAYDPDGNLLWNQLLPAEFGYNSIPSLQLAADDESVYFSGSVTGPLTGQCRAGYFDLEVGRYDSGGNQVWTRQFGTNQEDTPVAIAAASNGLYVVGAASTASAFLVKLEAAPQASSGPHIRNECVLNAANYVGGALAPGEIVTIFGASLGPSGGVSAQISQDTPLQTTLANTRVLFSGTPGPLLYASDRQTTAIVPYGLEKQTTVDVQVEYLGQKSSAVTLPMVDSRLGVFSLNGSGQGPAAVLNEDGTVNSPSNPARRGSVIAIFATGARLDGQVSEDSLVHSPPPALASAVQIGFTSPDFQEDDLLDCGDLLTTDPLSATGVAGAVSGLIQVNVRLPEWVVPGTWSPQLFQGSLSWFVRPWNETFASGSATIAVSDQ